MDRSEFHERDYKVSMEISLTFKKHLFFYLGELFLLNQI